MTLLEAVKNENLTVNQGNRKLYYENKRWKVIGRKYRAKNITVLADTESEEEAVDVLLNSTFTYF